ncbi:hypothetical protein D3C81_1586620 [compost metagenome]
MQIAGQQGLPYRFDRRTAGEALAPDQYDTARWARLRKRDVAQHAILGLHVRDGCLRQYGNADTGRHHMAYGFQR